MEEKTGPSFLMRLVAGLVLVFAVIILAKIVIGFVAGIFWLLVVIAALVAVFWAWHTLSS